MRRLILTLYKMNLKSFFATPGKLCDAFAERGAHKKLVRLTATLMYDNLSKRPKQVRAASSFSKPATVLCCATLASNRRTKPFASRSSSGLGHRPFTAATRVRFPYGTPHRFQQFAVARVRGVAVFICKTIERTRSKSNRYWSNRCWFPSTLLLDSNFFSTTLRLRSG